MTLLSVVLCGKLLLIIIIVIYMAPQNPFDAIVQLFFTKNKIKINVNVNNLK